MKMTFREEFKERTAVTRNRAAFLLKEAGYAVSASGPIDVSDRVWHKRDGKTGMPIHFDEYSYDSPAIPISALQGIPLGSEVVYTANTWSNSPHMRFQVHHVRIATAMDILAAEQKVRRFIQAFELERDINTTGTGLPDDARILHVGSPDMGRRVVTMRVPVSRESCVELCNDALRVLEERRETWEDSYEVHFRIHCGCANPPELSVSESDPGLRGGRIQLIHLVSCDDVVGRELVDDDMCAPFNEAVAHALLRDYIEERLDRMESKARYPEGS